MNRLKNAQKQLAESLAILESAVEQAQSSTAHVDGSDMQAHPVPVIDISQLSKDLTAIELDLAKAMKMIDELTDTRLSSKQDKDTGRI